jgi:serine/threonine protein kinase
MLNSTRTVRTGNTGTLEYCSPESLPAPHIGTLKTLDSKSDMWSLGMVLHRILFFRLPYDGLDGAAPDSRAKEGEKDRLDHLAAMVAEYAGFKPTPAHGAAFTARRIPKAYLLLLETLLNPVSAFRPSCDRVLQAIWEGRLDPLTRAGSSERAELVPVLRGRTPSQETLLNVQPASVSPEASQDRISPGAMVPLAKREYPRPESPMSDGKLKPPTPHAEVRVPHVALARIPWRRVVKSVVLGAKVRPVVPFHVHVWQREFSFLGQIVTLSIQPPGGFPPGSRGFWQWAVVVLFASADTLTDRMDVCFALGLAHLVSIRPLF